ncbi:hypothetical protein Q7A53_06015 [Halobacillus rhizosphaerae]|uniref:hypothetical protein n=1 Tax=Halobacillus rhizosphaerae TaxID=3064889 RepID=UPI00398B63E4
MLTHFENIDKFHENASIRIPNEIFSDLSKSVSTNIQQSSFAYVYLLTIGILYKYTNFVDLNNGTYIQNSDIKELLGYNRKTKTIDRIIKKDGVLDELGLTLTTSQYPIRFEKYHEKINNIQFGEFTLIGELEESDIQFSTYRNIVKNRNYSVKEPLFLTSGYKDSEYGTLYSIEKTHRILVSEYLTLIKDEDLDNIDIMLYSYLKSRCKGYGNNAKDIPLLRITKELGIKNDAFYSHLKKLETKNFIEVNHKNWRMPNVRNPVQMDANEYVFKGV